MIIGLDLSLTSTGVAVVHADGRLYSATAIKSKLADAPRLIDIRNNLYSILNKLSRKPTLAVLEGYAFGSQARHEAAGELGGIIKVTLFLDGIPVAVVPPSTLKKFVTGKGNAQKDEMRLAVFKKWGQEFRTNDEVDAFALAQVGVILERHKQGIDVKPELLKYEWEALQKVIEGEGRIESWKEMDEIAGKTLSS